MLLFLLLLTGAEIAVLAEDVSDIKDGDLSRKILGQSVVTSVSVVMDIGNGTKTIYSDPLGKPMEKPSNPSDLASPINLLNPDRYEFYTFDDNGNLVRRLMSLDEIKGIIATGDSDGLEYDSGFSEAYIPEKRVNDVLSNVQNVLKEEMEIHNTKLDNFPALDTPDVSDSWNMILPAVFGNSGADITPEKPPLHITPDTIMIEPTENSRSTPRSTPLKSTTTVVPPKVSEFISVSSNSASSISSSTTEQTSSQTNAVSTPIFTTESKQVSLDEITETVTKEYVPVSTITTQNRQTSTLSQVETSLKPTMPPGESEFVNTSYGVSSTESPEQKFTSNDNEFIKIDPILPSTANIFTDKFTELSTTDKDFVATPVVTNKIEIINETVYKITNYPELPIQSVESSVNCTSNKNEVETTVAPLFDDINSVDKIAAPEILDQLLSTPFVHDINTEIMQDTINQLINNAPTEITVNTNKIETNTSPKPVVNVGTTMEANLETVKAPLTAATSKTNDFTQMEDTSVVPTTISLLENTTISIQTEKTASPSTTTENSVKPVLENSNGVPIKSTKLEIANETVTTTTNGYEEIKQSSTENQETATTILIPVTLIEADADKQNQSTIRVPLIEPIKYLSITTTVQPSVNIIINEAQDTTPSLTNSVSNENKTEKIVIVDNSTETTTNKYNQTTSETFATFEKSFTTTEGLITEKPLETTKKYFSPTEKNIVQQTVGTQSTEQPLLITEKIQTVTKVEETTKSPPEEQTVKLTEGTRPITKPLSTAGLLQAVTQSLVTRSSEEPIETTTKLQAVTQNVGASSTQQYLSSEKTQTITQTVETRSTETSTTEKTQAVSKNIGKNSTEESLSTTEKIVQPVTMTKSTENPLSVTTGVTQTLLTTTLADNTFKEMENNKKEPNWTLVPTVVPHSGGTLDHPPQPIQNYPEVLEMSVPIDLKAEPFNGFGLEDSTSSLEKEIYQFSQLYNELAFEFWKSTTSTLSHARSVILSPFGAISLLAMIFLGARGSTSAEMNEILKLDDMITFNPHLVLKNVGESIVAEEKKSGIVTSAIIREMFSDKGKGKILPFYKERVRAFYDGYVEEVNFTEIGDIVRRRTNLQVKKQSSGKLTEFLTDMSITGNPPLLGLSVNIFQTDCSTTSLEGRDGEMHFTVLPSIRQRRLVPIPAALYKSGFLAGYEPSLDATVASIGDKTKTISTIFVMPGQQGIPAPGDGLARLEKSLVESSFKKGAWSRLLRSLIPRSGLEVQIPKIAHRSVINATYALNKMGFTEIFVKEKADLMGMNGVPNELYLSDILQVNQFLTCGERRTEHHSEIYPSRSGRTQRHLNFLQNEESFARDLSANSFRDSLHEFRYLDLPLPLRPRQARKPEVPRLKFDRPFLYFVRHNPTGLILHIGRFNPRLLP